jgi:hypothetical protein
MLSQSKSVGSPARLSSVLMAGPKRPDFFAQMRAMARPLGVSR